MDSKVQSKSGGNGALCGPPNGFLRVGPFIELPALLKGMGYDPQPVFAAAGFSLEQFANPDADINFIATSKLLAHCVQVTGCDHLGLFLGERTVPSSLGIPGFMLPAATDVGAALRALLRHLDLHDRGGTLTLTSNAPSTSLAYAIHLSGVAACTQIYDLSMTVAAKIMRKLCGANWNPVEVLLSHPKPKDTGPYRRYFQAPIRFDAEQSALVFQNSWLSHPIASADPLLFRHLENEAAAIHATQDSSMVVNVSLLLYKSLLDQNCDIGTIAGQLNVHERTLNRRLRDEGTTFREVLEQVRYDIALQQLAKPEVPISRIAEALNYSDSTAFSRAFRHWSGISPTKWRAHQK